MAALCQKHWQTKSLVNSYNKKNARSLKCLSMKICFIYTACTLPTRICLFYWGLWPFSRWPWRKSLTPSKCLKVCVFKLSIYLPHKYSFKNIHLLAKGRERKGGESLKPTVHMHSFKACSECVYTVDTSYPLQKTYVQFF